MENGDERSVPKYIREGRKDKRWRKVARFRMGNEMRVGKCWLKREEELCRVCG